MPHLLIITYIPLPEILQNTDKNLVHVLMDQLTVRGSQHVVGAPFLMEPQ